MSAKTMAEVLNEHAFHMINPVDIDDVNGPWQVECNCTATPFQGPSYLAAEEVFAAHQAMELANAGFGDVREARAGALDDAADIAGRPENRWWAEGQNRAKWLRSLAAAERDRS